MFFLKLFRGNKPRLNHIVVDAGWFIGVDKDEIIWEEFVEDDLANGGDKVFIFHIAWQCVNSQIIAECLMEGFGWNNDTSVNLDGPSFIGFHNRLDGAKDPAFLFGILFLL